VGVTNEKAVEALGQGRVAWQAWRESNPASRPDLSGAKVELDGSPGWWDFSGCVMTGCRLSCPGPLELDLRGSDFSRAEVAPRSTITGLRLDKGSILVGSRFAEVTIQGADFSSVILRETSFFRSSMQRVRFGGQLTEVDFGRAALTNVDLRDCELLGCNLASAKVHESDFDNARLHVAPGGGVPTTLESCVLRGCSFADTDFTGCSVKSAVIADSDLRRAKGLVLDETVLIGTPTSADAKDDWSVLRRSYTGANMVFNLIAMMVFFAPFIFQTLYWSSFNQAQLELIRGLGAAEVELARIPAGEVHAKAIKALQASIDPQFQRCLLGPGGAAASDSPSCRPIWQILLGLHEGWWAVVLSLTLLVYNMARLTLTWFVAPLRDEEVRTWHAPKRAAYAWMIHLHRVVRVLIWVAVAAAFLHLVPHLFSPVWLSSASSAT
jgi:uncharacterized protein YjbI with pentapeptide repeats